MLSAIENTALKVGLKINLKKTEYLLVGAWVDPVMISLSSGPLARVDDFKYLGSWLMNSMKDFEVRKALAWKAATRLVKVWKRKHMSRSLKLKLFLACVESVLLYNAVTWTMNTTLTKRLDGCYTRLLRYALGYTWTDKIKNIVLYEGLNRVSLRLQERRLRFLGHCYRSNQPVSKLLFWDHSLQVSESHALNRGNRSNFTKLLMEELQLEVEEIKNSMLNRADWDKRIKLVVRESSKNN